MSTIDAPLEWVETVGNLRLPPKTNQRLQELMDRNNEGFCRTSSVRSWNPLLNSVNACRWSAPKPFTCSGANRNDVVGQDRRRGGETRWPTV